MNRLLRFCFLPAVLVLLASVSIAQPVADFSVSGTAGCKPFAITVQNNSSGATSYYWDFDNGVTSFSSSPTGTSYSSTGTYTIMLAVASSSGVDTMRQTINVYDKPVVTFSGSPVTGCAPLVVNFTANVTLNGPGPADYSWDFGDGFSSNVGPSTQHTYAAGGPYNVFLQVGNGVCITTPAISRNAYITATAPPTATFTVNKKEECQSPATFNFTNTTSGATSTQWSFDGGVSYTTPSSSLTRSHTFTAVNDTTITVYMVATNAQGCSDTVTDQVQIITTVPSFTHPGGVCLNQEIFFTNTTPNATNTVWDYGDGVTDNFGKHTYLTAGTFTVQMTTNVSGCVKFTTLPVIVHPLPNTTISFWPPIPCPAPSNVTLTATTPGASTLSYAWEFGDNSTGTGNPVTHTYTGNGYKDVKVHVTNTTTQCEAEAELKELPIRGLIAEITATPEKDCIPLVPTFEVNLKSTLPPPPLGAPLPPYPVGANSWNWTFQNGTSTPGTSTAQNPTYTWNSVGTYMVTVTGTTPNGVSGCNYSASLPVHADVPVPASFTATPLTLCPEQLATFTNTSPNVPNTTYTWNFGNHAYDTTWTPTLLHSWELPGTYTVKLITDHFGCVDKAESTDYITINPAHAAFKFTRECSPNYSVQFTDISDGPVTTYSWDFGEPSSGAANFSSLASPQHTYAGPGTYQVKLTVTNATFGCTDDSIMTVRIFDPQYSFTADKTSICLGDEIEFTASFTGGDASPSFSWVFDNDPPTPYAADHVIKHTFTTRGYHTVKLLIKYDAKECLLSIQKPANYILVARPIVSFTGSPLIGCTPLSVTFNDASSAVPGTTIAQRTWFFGDGSPGFAAPNTTPSHVYNIPRNADVKLIITDNMNCKDSLTRAAYVVARKPVADFTIQGKIPACARDSVSFTNKSSGGTPLSYLWNFGDGHTDTAKNPKHAWAQAGTYTVTLTTTDSTPCSSTKSFTIDVASPVAAFSMDKNVAVCGTLRINFSNTSTGAYSYLWNFGDGGAPLQRFNQNPVNWPFVNPGKYDIVLTAKDTLGCTDTAMGHAYVLGYNGGFTIVPQDACLGQTITFTPPVNTIPEIFWDFNDGNLIRDTTSGPVTHTYTGTGPYWPKAIYSNKANCRSADSSLAPVRLDDVQANFTVSTPCIGVPFTLTNASTAVYSVPNSLRWFLTSTDSATGTSATFTFNTAGNHPIRLIATNDWGCSDTLLKNVYINPLPNIDAGPADTGICPGDTISLTGRGGVSYVWGPDSLVTCTACTTTRAWKAEPPTTFYVTGTDANGCINQDSITARIQIKTSTDVRPGGAICLGDSFRLEARNATTYKWQPVRFLDSPNIASPMAKPIITTQYVLESQEGTCLIRFDTVTVVVHPIPFFDAGYDEVINYGASVMLKPTRKDIASIEWRPDSTLSCIDCFDPIAKPTYTTRYYATGISQYGCIATDSVLVRVRCNGDSVFIPNTFTPNGDGLNEVFFPRGKGIDLINSFRIFNRWGEMVFERFGIPVNDERAGWDGTFKGKQLAPDVYIYVMQTRCPSGEPIEWKGDITLIR